jgi:fermentation-respiration switch protein FrsA (DUF1100 family)
MGASTALLHAFRDHSIAGLVLDSAFTDLTTVAKEVASQHTKAPGFLLSLVLSSVRKTIKKKANFDIDDLKPIDHTDCFIPALFATGTSDTFVLPHHTQELYEKYAGDKQAVYFEGNHHGSRPDDFINSVVVFFYNVLQGDHIETPPELAAIVPNSSLVSHLNVQRND